MRAAVPTVLEVRLGESGATSMHGLARDEVVGGPVLANVDLRLETADGAVTSLTGVPSLEPLIGRAGGQPEPPGHR